MRETIQDVDLGEWELVRGRATIINILYEKSIFNKIKEKRNNVMKISSAVILGSGEI